MLIAKYSRESFEMSKPPVPTTISLRKKRYTICARGRFIELARLRKRVLSPVLVSTSVGRGMVPLRWVYVTTLSRVKTFALRLLGK